MTKNIVLVLNVPTLSLFEWGHFRPGSKMHKLKQVKIMYENFENVSRKVNFERFYYYFEVDRSEVSSCGLVVFATTHNSTMIRTLVPAHTPHVLALQLVANQ